jgi:hypothetical protein
MAPIYINNIKELSAVLQLRTLIVISIGRFVEKKKTTFREFYMDAL